MQAISDIKLAQLGVRRTFVKSVQSSKPLKAAVHELVHVGFWALPAVQSVSHKFIWNFSVRDIASALMSR